MTIRFGVSPIAWINDDMPELGAGTSLETLLSDAAAIGFSGVELGGSFPRDPGLLAPLLVRHGLALVGGWYSGSLLEQDAGAEIMALQPHLSLLKAMGCGVFIFAETSNAIHGRRDCPLSNTPRLPTEAWPGFGERLTAVADYIAGQGLRLAYHHHLGTSVETEADLETFLAHTGEVVGLTVDTGHAALGGIDAAALIRARPERVAHVHCKDVRQPRFDALKARNGSFLDGVLDGMFTAPGDGRLDYGAVMQALADIGYGGWVVVEAEQDPALADPRDYSRLGLATLRHAAEAAGLVVEG